DLLHAMQALSQLSYSPKVPLDLPFRFALSVQFVAGTGRILGARRTPVNNIFSDFLFFSPTEQSLK
ncbi:hypothetical protein, partial [Pseudomonas nitroreducens]